MTLLWYPERLNLAILSSFQVSMGVVEADAAAGGSANAGAELTHTGPTSATLTPTGSAGVFEEEGAAPHIIEPKAGGVLYLRELDIFTSAPVHHPGREARPYLHPAAARWAHGGYQATARGVLNAQGF